MKYYRLNCLGNINNDKTLAVVGGYSDDFTDTDSPVFGDAIGAAWPTNVRAYLDPRFKGVKVTSFLTNSDSYILVTDDAKRVFEDNCKTVQIEYLRLSLYNHKKRLHHAGCWIVNPIGSFDCLSVDKSDILWTNHIKGGEVASIKEAVLEKKKLKNAPPLFRIKERTSFCVFSEQLVRGLEEAGCTNFVFAELRVV